MIYRGKDKNKCMQYIKKQLWMNAFVQESQYQMGFLSMREEASPISRNKNKHIYYTDK